MMNLKHVASKVFGRGAAKIIVSVLLLAVYALILLHKIELPVGDDLPRLIQNGKTLFHNTDVLTKNVYSYTEPDQSFANHHWLSGVFFYALDEIVGYKGLVIFKVIILTTAFGLLFFVSIRRANFWIVAWLALPTIMILSSRSLVRPEIFSYLLISVYLLIFHYSREHPGSRWLFFLIPLQILWTNLHLFFGVGVLMVWGFALEQFIRDYPSHRFNAYLQKLVGVAIGVTLGCLLNPYGPRGALFSLTLNLSKSFPIDILENRSLLTWLQANNLFHSLPLLMFVICVPIFFICIALSFRNKPIFYALGGAGAAALGWAVIRAIPFFGFMFLPGASEGLTHGLNKVILHAKGLSMAWKQRLFWIQWSILVSLCLLIIGLRLGGILFAYPRLGIGVSARSTDAARFFLEHNLHGPIFNDTDIGSYLIYYLYPQERVFIDNRFGDAYSAEFVSDVYLPMINEESVWQQKQAEYRFNAIFVYMYDDGTGFRQFFYRRLHDPDWSLVHVDRYNAIFLRNNDENKAIIDEYGITADNVGRRLAGLTEYGVREDMVVAGDIFNFIGRIDYGMQTFLKVATTWPRYSKVWLILGEWELDFDDPRTPILGMMYLEKAVDLGQRNYEAYTYLGSAYMRMGLYDKAEQILNKALRKQKDSTQAKDLLKNISELRQYEPAPITEETK